jgi:lipopolysaccharide/colanic/teichoic acid biosynthesis glycosyltransferase
MTLQDRHAVAEDLRVIHGPSAVHALGAATTMSHAAAIAVRPTSAGSAIPLTAPATHLGTTERTAFVDLAASTESTESCIASRAGSRYDRFAKPVIDRLTAGVLLLLALPALALVALVVLVTLGRPVLFVQQRVGRDGHAFGMLKFRTMHPDRRQRLQPVPVERDRRRHHKSDADPRHTRIGRFLRQTSLDELPQLWNVMRGDMSLVGPRPELPAIVSRYHHWQHQRHQVKPGITGLWQVTERAHSAGEMHLHTATDIAYLQRLSLRTDLAILLRTPACLARGR